MGLGDTPDAGVLVIDLADLDPNLRVAFLAERDSGSMSGVDLFSRDDEGLSGLEGQNESLKTLSATGDGNVALDLIHRVSFLVARLLPRSDIPTKIMDSQLP